MGTLRCLAHTEAHLLKSRFRKVLGCLVRVLLVSMNGMSLHDQILTLDLPRANHRDRQTQDLPAPSHIQPHL